MIYKNFFLVALFLISSLCLADETILFVVDIDGTLGEQTTNVPDFYNGDVATVPHDPYGDFFFFPGALDFMRTLFAWSADPQFQKTTIHVALFTMGSGARNEIIRDYIAHRLNLRDVTFNVFDYSDAVFSEDIVNKFKNNDPSLSPSQKHYFESLDKPLKYIEKIDRLYVKDLSKLLLYYSGLSLENIRIFDDNAFVVPGEQTGQHIVATPQKTGYQPAIEAFVQLLK